MLGNREKTILEILVREYIENAEPVSSRQIAEQLGRALSPASIRNTFVDLTNEGFIDQPHVSGGRIPLAKAYRFFVDELISHFEDVLPEYARRKQFTENENRLREFQEDLVRKFHVLSVLDEDRPIGFSEIIEEPEFAEPSMIRELARFLDEASRYTSYFEEELEPEHFTVVIGDENSLQKISNISYVAAKSPEGRVLIIAGPTRMPYDRIINQLRLWNLIPQKI